MNEPLAERSTQDVAPGEMYLGYQDKKVPHETQAQKSISVNALWNGADFVADPSTILDGFFDAPGLSIQNGQIIGEIQKGQNQSQSYPKMRNFQPAVNVPCPVGCGGVLNYVGQNRVRCSNCSEEFIDNQAR
jgi:hypothetical protein